MLKWFVVCAADNDNCYIACIKPPTSHSVLFFKRVRRLNPNPFSRPLIYNSVNCQTLAMDSKRYTLPPSKGVDRGEMQDETNEARVGNEIKGREGIIRG
jgi:hypothetical protein